MSLEGLASKGFFNVKIFNEKGESYKGFDGLENVNEKGIIVAEFPGLIPLPEVINQVFEEVDKRGYSIEGNTSRKYSLHDGVTFMGEIKRRSSVVLNSSKYKTKGEFQNA